MRRSRLLFAFPSRERLCFGIAVSPFRSLPHWGRGTASAVDRVLSYIVDLRRISSLSFIPLEPYPARFARHLPHAGKALCRKYRHPHTHNKAALRRYLHSAAGRLIYFNRGNSMSSGRR